MQLVAWCRVTGSIPSGGMAQHGSVNLSRIRRASRRRNGLYGISEPEQGEKGMWVWVLPSIGCWSPNWGVGDIHVGWI